VSGTDPNPGFSRRDDKTQPFRPGGPTDPPPPPPDAPKIPGITIHYEIARGGMGVVYAGRQDFLDRRVAVKFLSVELGGPSFAQRFQREAKILAGIKHPNIVACHLAGTTDSGQSYLVMEFIDGPSLKDWIRKNGPLAPASALRLVRATAQALAHAYQLEVIHRDVKPENILLETMTSTAIDMAFPYTPKLVDLGLARMAHEQAGMGLTSPGSVMGTPMTMSPEQFDEPDSVDFRSDIYGLGCVLYEALVGHPAYRGSKLTDIVTQKRQPVGPDPCAEMKSVPPAVGALVQRMLAADRNDRPGSYRELDELIADLLGGLGPAASRPPGDEDFERTRPSPAPGAVGKSGGGKAASSPNLLRTAELDFLSAGGAAAPDAAAGGFRDSGVVTQPAGASPRRRGGIYAAVALVAIAGGGYALLGGGGGGGNPADPSPNGGTRGNGANPVPDVPPVPATANQPPVVRPLEGPDTVDLGKTFQLRVDATDPEGKPLRYAWEWPNGVVPVTATARPAVTFRVDDGLPGVPFTITVEVLDGSNDPVKIGHTFTVGACPVDLPLVGFDARPQWRVDRTDRRWVYVNDPTDPHVSCRAGADRRSLSTALGNEPYWEWFGSLESSDAEGTDYAALGLALDFGTVTYAVRCRRRDGGALWSIEVVEAVRSGDKAEFRSLPEPLIAEWREPEDTVDEQRRGDELRFTFAEARKPAPTGADERPDEVVRGERSRTIALPAEAAAGDLTLFVDQGIGRFRLKRR
jgi:serine/threonine protein kinase